jgi:outer membrane protein assembly factor BamB
LFYGDEYPAKKVWCKLLSNFSTKWDISLSDIFLQQSNLEMEGHPLVMNDIVIFPITEGGLIAIDIKSGDLKWHLFDLDRPYQGFVLNDAVCFVGEWFLIEIDLRHGEIMRKVDIRTLSFKYDFNIGLVKLYDNRIYFTDNRNKQIGILDYQTLQLLDLYQLEKQKDPLTHIAVLFLKKC